MGKGGSQQTEPVCILPPVTPSFLFAGRQKKVEWMNIAQLEQEQDIGVDFPHKNVKNCNGITVAAFCLGFGMQLFCWIGQVSQWLSQSPATYFVKAHRRRPFSNRFERSSAHTVSHGMNSENGSCTFSGSLHEKKSWFNLLTCVKMWTRHP